MFKKSILLAVLLMSSGLSFGANQSLIPIPRTGPFSDPNAISIKRCGLSLDEKNELMEALASNRFAEVQARFDNMTPEQLEKSFFDGYKTWLHYAVEGKNVAAVQYFIERGMNVNTITKSTQITPLFCAVELNDLEVVQALIRAPSIDLNIQCRDDGMTALCLAAYDGCVDVAEALIEAGASSALTDNKGNSPLHYAMGRGMMGDTTGKIATMLVQKGAFLFVPNGDAETPVMLAQRIDNQGVLWALYDNGCSVPKPSSPRPDSGKVNTPSKVRKALRAAWILGLTGSGFEVYRQFKKIKKTIIEENKAAAEKTDTSEFNKLARQELWKKHKKLISLFAGSVAGGLVDFGMWCVVA